jgi:hypothetical protein
LRTIWRSEKGNSQRDEKNRAKEGEAIKEEILPNSPEKLILDPKIRMRSYWEEYCRRSIKFENPEV